MPSDRPRSRPRSEPAPETPDEPAFLQRIRPDLSGRGLARLAMRSAAACATVGVLMTVANWHSSGRIKRGEIDRMLRMAGPPAPAAAKPPGRLDRARLNALVTAAGR